MCSLVMRKKPLLKLHSLHDCCWNLSPFLPLRDSFIGLAKTLNATQILLTAWAHIFYPEPACDVHLCTHSRAKKWNLLFLRNAVDVKAHWTSPHTLLPVILARGPFLALSRRYPGPESQSVIVINKTVLLLDQVRSNAAAYVWNF